MVNITKRLEALEAANPANDGWLPVPDVEEVTGKLLEDLREWVNDNDFTPESEGEGQELDEYLKQRLREADENLEYKWVGTSFPKKCYYRKIGGAK